MFHSPVILWLVLAVVFLVVECSTIALVTVWFAIGALAALGVCLLGGVFGFQVAVFLAVSALLLAMLRPMLRKHVKFTKTNVDSIIDTQGVVTVPVDNIAFTGEVKLGAMTWTARSTDGSPIGTGTCVKVDRIEGVKVFVSPVKVPAVNG